MKRAIFILTLGLCLLLSDGAHAQRALPAMRGLEIRGGIRVVLLFKNSFTEMKRIIHPNAVINVKYNDKKN